MPTLTPTQLASLQVTLSNDGTAAFYEELIGYGDQYASLALDVTNNQGWQGRLANAFAASGAAQDNVVLTYGSDNWISVNDTIAQAYLARYNLNSGVQPDWSQIQTIHNVRYAAVGASADSWFPNKMLNDADPGDRADLWGDWMNTAHAADIIEDAREVAEAGGVFDFGAYFTRAPWASVNYPLFFSSHPDEAKFAENFKNALLGLDNNGWHDLAEDVLGTDAYNVAWMLYYVSQSSEPTSALAIYLKSVFGIAETQIDPLVLDLNANGEIELNAASTVYFDIDADGFADAVNWVAATDGMLAIDANENGNIDNIEELFGSATEDGFSVLATFDLNSDDTINSSDAIWADLVVWQDFNQDGFSQSNELLTLTSLGIMSIDLAGVVNAGSNPAITHDSTITTTTGTMRISNVLFDVDAVNTRFAEEYTLDVDTLFLPTLRGYGLIPDLYIATSVDTSDDSNGHTLKEKLQLIAGYGIFDLVANFETVKDTIQTLMFHWAGVEGVATNSRGAALGDARRVEFFERYLADEYLNVAGSTNVPTLPARMIDGMWNEVFLDASAKLFAQSSFSTALTNALSYDAASDTLTINGSLELSQSALDDLADYAAGLSSTYARSEFWQGFGHMLSELTSVLGLSNYGLDSTEEQKLDDAIQASDATLTWYVEDHNVGGLFSVEAALTGFSGLSIVASTMGGLVTGSTLDDLLTGNTNDDEIEGLGGNDTIRGDWGNDELNGGDGDDTIHGEGLATNAYGDDIIDGGDGNDTIYGGIGDDTIFGGSGNDVLFGDAVTMSFGEDTIDGGLGNDHLVGGESDDLLIDGYGSTGENLMDGGAGYNTYRVVGGGAEVWIDDGYGVLEVPPAYTDENDLTFSREGHFIKVEGSISGSEINVYIDNEFSPLVDKIRFASSYEFDLETHIYQMMGIPTQLDDVIPSADTSPSNTYADVIYALGGNDIVYGNGGNDTLHGEAGHDTLYGEDGGDHLYGEDGNDTLDGGADVDYLFGDDGNDTLKGGAGDDGLVGGAGDDTYVFEAGDGTDYITEQPYDGFDTIRMEGFDPEDVRLWRDIYSRLNVIGGGTTVLLPTYATGVDNEFSVAIYLERVLFDDATSWSLAAGLPLTGTASGENGYGTQHGDTISGLAGADSLYGYRGNDTLHGGDDDDTLYGGDGADTLNGDSGEDTLYGEAGNDILDGGADFSVLYGGTGDDTYIVDLSIGSAWAIETADEGINTVELVGLDPGDVRFWTTSTAHFQVFSSIGAMAIPVTFTGSGTNEFDVAQHVAEIVFDGTTTMDTSEGFTLTGTDTSESGYGTTSDDTIYGLDGDDTLYGNGGNDTIYGGDDEDTLYGGNGADTLDGGANFSMLYGGTGDDTYVIDLSISSAWAIESASEGIDTVELVGMNLGDLRFWTTASGHLQIFSSLGAMAIAVSLTGNGTYELAIDQHIEEIVFADTTTMSLAAGLTLNGTSSAENGYGTAYADTINGHDGADNLYGNAGADTLNGGDGDDWHYGGDGNDTVNGGDGADVLYGNAGDDSLNAGDGVDAIAGGDCEDVIHGGAGDDYLYGGGDDDILYGEAGSDLLAGEGGADIFVFEAATAYAASDNIVDFSLLDDDKIDISDLLAAFNPLTDVITDFVEITTSGYDSILKVDADGGADNFVQVATIQYVTGLTDEAALVTSGNLIVT